MNDFFQEIREDEEYVNCSMRMNVFLDIHKTYERGLDYELHFIKEKNQEHYKDEILTELYKQKRKIAKKISEREQELNHNK